MSDLHEMSDAVYEIVLNKTKLKAKRPDISDIFALTEASMISREMEKIKTASESFELEGDEKLKFLRESMQELPKGLSLQEIVWEEMSRPEGIGLILLKAVQTVSPDTKQEDIMPLVNSDPDNATAWAEYLIGASKKAPTVESKKHVRK